MKSAIYYIQTLIKSIYRSIEHDAIEHAGYMSFMVLLSIFPFLIFFLAITSFFGASELGENFTRLIIENTPDSLAEMVKRRIYEISSAPPQRLMTLAIIGSIWTASSFVECIRTILNRAFCIKSPPDYIKRRLLSILQFFIISMLVSFAMFLLVIIPIGLRKIPEITALFEDYAVALGIMRYVLVFSSLLLSVTILYYIIPNTRLKIKNLIPGACLVVLLWMVSGKFLSKYIIYYNQLNLLYGSLGSIIITLIFFYIINFIFILGAEFNNLLKEE